MRPSGVQQWTHLLGCCHYNNVNYNSSIDLQDMTGCEQGWCFAFNVEGFSFRKTMCSLRCYGTPDLRFGRVTLILFGVEKFCVLYLRVSSFGTFIGYFRGVVTARDRCANADWTVKFLRTIGTKPKSNLLSQT